ncbi:hypothetical protein O181_131792 [Austropuccinia psidii MF-1]|uniref:Uncharacterized protein n=1 Tax=Austropuccinia psidii MF-1 TaxID=1389203 RepID=A0A9Q3L3T2_9BASI|nr:hypothetical protein [Austropuccinia psidii MF-1]
MPSTREEASSNPSSSFQKGNRNDYGRSQSVKEEQGSVNESQTNELCHFKADNTVLPLNRADNPTRSLSGHLQSQQEGIQQCIVAQIEPDT